MERFDVLVIGAGITGVAVARALALREPRRRVCVLEKEAGPARHTSGRNSGVVHAGFNPKPGTLKARFCVEGNRRTREFCARRGVPLREIGTLVVARDRREVGVLEELDRRGRESGVPGLDVISAGELRRREPRATGCAALWASSGAVVGGAALVEALAAEAREAGVEFRFGRRVEELEEGGAGYRVTAGGETFEAPRLVNAAGAHADRLAHRLGAGLEYTILPFRGEYYYVRDGKADLVRTMVYPVPDLGFPFLGVHFTPTVDGHLTVGPNAVPALGREAYGRLEFDGRDVLGMVLDARSWRLARRPEFRRLAVRQARTSLSRRAFWREASELVEGLALEDLVAGPPPGIRAQLVDRAGRLIEDMTVERKGGAVHILNVVSPGMTCALPFADYVVDQLG